MSTISFYPPPLLQIMHTLLVVCVGLLNFVTTTERNLNDAETYFNWFKVYQGLQLRFV